MGYGSAAGVQALIPQAGTLSGSTVPTTTQLTQWLAEGYAIINRHLVTAGYAVPVDSTAAAYAEMTGLENLYAAAQVARALGIDLTSGENQQRAEAWLEEFFARLKALASANLAAMGVSPITTTESAGKRRRRLRSMQMRRVDGYSGAHEGAVAEYDAVSD